MVFEDRHHAGKELAALLKRYQEENPIILGMPRGGVVLAYEVALALDAPLDVIVARKIGAPDQPELAIGAIAPKGVRIFNEALVKSFGLSSKDLDLLVKEQEKEMHRRIDYYRGDETFPDIGGRIVIVVDDGLATGLTALATIRSIRLLKPKRIILAVGVCAIDSAELLTKEVDELVCLSKPYDFYAVGQWYRNFDQVSDKQVMQYINAIKNKKKD